MNKTIANIFIFFTLISVVAATAQAQEPAQELDRHALKLLARPLPDSVMLRWAPDSYRLWLTGNQYGYLVTRTLIYRNGQIVTDAPTEQLTPTPLKPAPLSQWEALADSSDMAGIAAQAIYGADFDVDAGPQPTGIKAHFERASVQENKLGFALLAADQDARVAHLSGLALTDKNVQKGCKYLYRVFPASLPLEMTVDTAIFYTGTDEYLPLVAPANLRVSPDNRMATLTWERFAQEGLFSGYFVERSADGGKTFVPLNQSPLINTTPANIDDAPFHFYIDSLPDNQTELSYRIRGITPFGETSPYSNTVKTTGKNTLMAAPPISDLFSSDNHSVTVEWETPLAIDSVNTRVKVERSNSFDGPFDTVAHDLPMTAHTFTDKAPLNTGYYRLRAYNNSSEGPAGSPRLVQLVDETPPAPPTGLTALADTTGKVVLRWLRNSDPDMFGYRIFRANGKNEEFSQITDKPTSDTVFVDNIELKTLSKQVFYRVVAIDKRQNRSDFSETYQLERPDVVPPSAPSFRSIVPTEQGINLQWFPSSAPDVVLQYLYRNSEANPKWTLLAKLAPSDSAYSDTALTDGLFRYLLVAADKSGNESDPTKPVAGRFNKAPREPKWLTSKTKIVKDKNIALIRWDPLQTSASSLFIYGMTKKHQWRLIAKTPNNGLYHINLEMGFYEFKISQ